MSAAKRAFSGCFGRRPAATASWIIAWMRGLAAVSATRCAGAAMSRTLSGLASAECGLRNAVLRETWEEPFEEPLPNFSREIAVQPRQKFQRLVAPTRSCGRDRRRANSVCGSWHN